MTSDRIAIVLIADQAYTEQLTVTMKSIMYHNKISRFLYHQSRYYARLV